MPCPYCQREHKRSKNGPCPACYQAIYTDTPEGKASYEQAKRRYERSEKGKATRASWLPGYRVSRGEYVHPDVHELRQALKALERALVDAGERP